MFLGIILTRILFAACMVFIIGYVFGNFSKKPVLTTLTKVAAVLVIVLFISATAFRFGGWGRHHAGPNGSCYYQQKDSVLLK